MKSSLKILFSVAALYLGPVAMLFGQNYDFSAATDQLQTNLSLYGNSGVVAVVEQGTNRIFNFAGTAGLPGLQITENTKVAIASCSKWLSGAVVLICAERGYFNLDDRIGNYLPIFDTFGKGDITIRQCFAMNSGLALADPDYETMTNLTLAASVDLIASNTPVVFTPGTQLDYEGDGMQVVGRICEVTTGKDWRTLANEVLFAPLGMASADYLAFGLNPSIPGGARCKSSDYLKFLRMILNNGVATNGLPIISSRSVQVFFANQTFGLPEYYSPWPPSFYFPYLQRPDYGMGSWIFAQSPTNGVVEEVCSPGAFGTFPWVDRRRGLRGIIFMLGLNGFSNTANNNLKVIAALRSEIDAVGLPPTPAHSNLSSSVTNEFLRIDWSGGGVLETSTNLSDWTALPWATSPFAENLNRPPSRQLYYRVKW